MAKIHRGYSVPGVGSRKLLGIMSVGMSVGQQKVSERYKGGVKKEPVKSTTAQAADAQKWFFYCTLGKFRIHYGYKVPEFSELENLLLGGLLHDTSKILFIGNFPMNVYNRFAEGLEATITGYIIEKGKDSKRIKGDVRNVFDRYEAECGNTPRVAIVDIGYHALKAFLNRRYGSATDLAKRGF